MICSDCGYEMQPGEVNEHMRQHVLLQHGGLPEFPLIGSYDIASGNGYDRRTDEAEKSRVRRSDKLIMVGRPKIYDSANPSGDSIFYMSFCDPDKPVGTQFLGACIVIADEVSQAMTVSHLFGCNPGGEVGIMGPLPRSAVKPEYLNRLLTAQEAQDAGANVRSPDENYIRNEFGETIIMGEWSAYDYRSSDEGYAMTMDELCDQMKEMARDIAQQSGEGALHIFVADGNCLDEDLEFCAKQPNITPEETQFLSRMLYFTPESREGAWALSRCDDAKSAGPEPH